MACYHRRHFELFYYYFIFSNKVDCGEAHSESLRAGETLRKEVMSTPTWKDCFDYVIRYGSIGGHPPFLPRTRLNVFLSRSQLLGEIFLGVRMFMTVVHFEKGFFLGLIFFIYVVNILTRMVQINVCANEYRDYFGEVNDFLRQNENNPITGRKNHFMEIWRKERPQKLALALLITSTAIFFTWYGVTVYGVIEWPENTTPLYWSPFFDKSKYIRWFWALHEILPGFSMTYLSWYLNVTFTSLVTFQYAQLLYVRELAIATTQGGDEKDTNENMTRWLQTHQQVLGLTSRVTNLLALHALSAYFAQMLYLGLSIVLLLFENVTQTESQKILCLALGVSHVMEFGYNCIMVDRWEEVQNSLRNIIFTEKMLEGNKWRESAYKIFMVRAAKPLIFTGYYFVVLNSATFRGIDRKSKTASLHPPISLSNFVFKY